MAIENGNGHFVTKNTALAAYLRLEGFNLLEVRIGNNSVPASFLFEQNTKIPDCERLWQLGKAQGNLLAYFENYRLCLRMVKVGKL